MVNFFKKSIGFILSIFGLGQSTTNNQQADVLTEAQAQQNNSIFNKLETIRLMVKNDLHIAEETICKLNNQLYTLQQKCLLLKDHTDLLSAHMEVEKLINDQPQQGLSSIAKNLANSLELGQEQNKLQDTIELQKDLMELIDQLTEIKSIKNMSTILDKNIIDYELFVNKCCVLLDCQDDTSITSSRLTEAELDKLKNEVNRFQDEFYIDFSKTRHILLVLNNLSYSTSNSKEVLIKIIEHLKLNEQSENKKTSEKSSASQTSILFKRFKQYLAIFCVLAFIILCFPYLNLKLLNNEQACELLGYVGAVFCGFVTWKYLKPYLKYLAMYFVPAIIVLGSPYLTLKLFNDEQAGALLGYIGAIFGGFVTWIGVNLTLKYTSIKNAFDLEQANTNILVQHINALTRFDSYLVFDRHLANTVLVDNDICEKLHEQIVINEKEITSLKQSLRQQCNISLPEDQKLQQLLKIIELSSEHFFQEVRAFLFLQHDYVTAIQKLVFMLDKLDYNLILKLLHRVKSFQDTSNFNYESTKIKQSLQYITQIKNLLQTKHDGKYNSALIRGLFTNNNSETFEILNSKIVPSNFHETLQILDAINKVILNFQLVQAKTFQQQSNLIQRIFINILKDASIIYQQHVLNKAP